MSDKKFEVIDEQGNKREAEMLTVLKIDETEREYAIYSISKPDTNEVIICASILVKDANGNETIADITNMDEKTMVINIVKNMIIQGEKNE